MENGRSGGQQKPLQILSKNKIKIYADVCESEVRTLKSVKIQFSLLLSFSMNRNEEVEHMRHYFNRMQPIVLNEHNIDTLSHLLNPFIDEVKGEIEAWSQRGSGWVIDEILEAFINVAQYQPLRGGSYMELPKKLQAKKAIINVKNRDNQCLRWAIRAALFAAPRGMNVSRTTSYPAEDGLNLQGLTSQRQFHRSIDLKGRIRIWP